MGSTFVCDKCGSQIVGEPGTPCPGCLLNAAAANAPSSSSNSQLPPTIDSRPKQAFEAPAVETINRLLPHLQVEALIGCGGMGAVYRARQPELDRLVAIKVLPQETQQGSDHEQRFRREARALAKLNHPHIITLYDFGRSNGLIYFVMEFVEGVTLRDMIASRSLKSQDALSIVSQICDALQFAHEEGVVHRDIKPENILVDQRGRVKVADFGLAKLMAGEESIDNLTGTQQVMGTMRYMAPEQMNASKSVDHRADIYSLGVVFYELLTGDLPMGWFAPPSKRVNVDVRLDEVVLRSLEAEPNRRYQQISEVKIAVDNLASSTDQAVESTLNTPPTPTVTKIDAPPASGSHHGSTITHKLLDVTDTRNRVLHHATFLAAFLLLSFAGVFAVAVNKSYSAPSASLQSKWIVCAIAGVSLGIWSVRIKRRLRWEVPYKGHRIVFDAGGMFAEQLFIDDGLVKLGGFGLKMEIRAAIKAGAGNGDTIVVWYDARYLYCRCRIVAEEAMLTK